MITNLQARPTAVLLRPNVRPAPFRSAPLPGLAPRDSRARPAGVQTIPSPTPAKSGQIPVSPDWCASRRCHQPPPCSSPPPPRSHWGGTRTACPPAGRVYPCDRAGVELTRLGPARPRDRTRTEFARLGAARPRDRTRTELARLGPARPRDRTRTEFAHLDQFTGRVQLHPCGRAGGRRDQQQPAPGRSNPGAGDGVCSWIYSRGCS